MEYLKKLTSQQLALAASGALIAAGAMLSSGSKLGYLALALAVIYGAGALVKSKNR